ncbi:DUF2971 domain-containing protein [Promicromonospora sp. Marseille-Q5078]
MKVGKRFDGSIYHYTSAATFLNLILPYGRLRLSSIVRSIDPREKLSINLGFTGAIADEAIEGWMDNHDAFRSMIRDNAHILCFANSYEPLFPARQWDHEGDRGWAHAAMWAHFADRHAGVCLEIDRDLFIEDFASATADSAISIVGDIVYVGSDDNRIGVPNLPVRGAHAPSLDRMFSHAVHNSIGAFFQKDKCWSYENEFRAIALNSCGEPIYVPLNRSLRRVIVSGAFSEQLKPVLEWSLINAGLDAEVQILEWVSSAMTFAPHALTESSGAAIPVEGARLVQSASQEHSHGPACRPRITEGEHEDAQLSIWRTRVVSAHRRRVSKSLEEVSAVFFRAFSRESVQGLSAPGMDTQGVWDTDIFELSGYVEQSDGSRVRDLLTISLGVTWANPTADSFQIRLDGVHVPSGTMCCTTWTVLDSDSDAVLMDVMAQVDQAINDLLLGAYGSINAETTSRRRVMLAGQQEDGGSSE